MNVKKPLKFSKKTTLAEYLEYWYSTYIYNGIRDNTRHAYMLLMEKHIIPRIGDLKLSAIRTETLQDFFNDEYDHGNLVTGGQLSVKTLRNIKGLMSAAFEKACMLDYIPKNYVNGVELPTYIKPNLSVFTPEEEKKIKTCSLLDSNIEYGFAYWLLDTFGLRIGEVCGLKWTDFDFKNLTFHVQRSTKRNRESYRIELGQPKTAKSDRIIPFTKEVRDCILDIQKKRIKSGYYSVHNATGAMKDFIFVSYSGTYADSNVIFKHFKQFLDELGIDSTQYHPHSLRHTFATRGIEKGVDIKTLSELLGHESVQFTLDTYAHVLDDQKRKVMEILLKD